ICLAELRHREEAEELLRRAAELRLEMLGPAHPQLGLAYYDLADHYRQRGDYDEAENWLRRTLDIERLVYGETSRNYLESLGVLPRIQEDAGKLPSAADTRREVARLWGQGHPDAAIQRAEQLCALARLEQRLGAADAARDHETEALGLVEDRFD